MACKIIYNEENEITKVLAPNNKESILFDSILGIPGINEDKQLALRQWAYTYTREFKDKFGDWEAEPDQFKDKLDANGEPLVDYITDNVKSKLETLKTGDKNILEQDPNLKFDVDTVIEQASEIETEGFQVEDLIEPQARLNKVYDKLQDNLDYQLKIIQKYEKDGSHPLTERIQDIISTLKKYSDNNKIRGVIHYINSINKEIKVLESSLDKKDKTNTDMVRVLENYKKYLSLFDVIDDIAELYTDAVQAGAIPDSRLSTRIKNIKSIHDSVQGKFVAITREYMANNLNDIKYHPKVESKWKERLERQYNEIYADVPSKLKDKGSKKNWINQKLVEYRPEIAKEVDKATKKLIYNKAFDITYFAEQFLSSLEINSDIVQIFQQELSEIRDKIIEEITPIDARISKVFEAFKKEKGAYNPEKQFENILQRDSNGNVFLKGNFKVEFMEKQEELKAIYDERKTVEKNTDKHRELTKKANELRKSLYVIKGRKTVRVKDEWKNDLSNLSKAEADVLELFKSITQTSSTNTLGINSLVRSVGFVPNTLFYKLPSLTKSDLERIIGQKGKGVAGIIKDKYTDLTTTRPDDIGYEQVKATASGELIRDVPIHFRGKIDPKNQSLDLFTMFKMEAQNGIAFKHRKNKEMFLEMIIDIASNKDYYQTKGLSFVPLLNRFAKRNKDLALKGNENTKVIKKLKGIMDSQLYDITKKHQGKFGKYDIQKMVGFINGYTGMLGMSLNYHSALVNLTGGYAQFLIHAMAKDVINVGNIKNALAVYSKNIKENMADIQNPDDRSFTNQVNIMFDTFGGYNIGTQSFLKDKAWKKFANLHGLTVLHQMGEHQLQSVITMAVLDSVGALDSKGKPIQKDGKDASLLNMLYLDDNGRLKMDDKVVYNTHSPLTAWNKGGRVQVQQLLKYKMFQTLGNYDDNLQPEIMKTAQGRLLLMFRRFFIPLALNRFRGVGTAFKNRDAIKEEEKFYSFSNKRYEEGSYTTTIRFLKNNLLPAMKNLKLQMVMQDYSKLTDYEKSNINKASIEVIMGITMGILAGLIGQAAKEDDDEMLYFLAYTMRRTESELRQFYSLQESYRITKTPFASLRTLENTTNLLGMLLNPLSWNDEYKSGKRKGELKLTRQIQKMFPLLNQIDRENKELYNYLNSNFLSL